MASRCSVIRRRGTGLMAGSPTATDRPERVTVPTPSPAWKCMPASPASSRRTQSRAPWVASGSSPASLMTPAVAAAPLTSRSSMVMAGSRPRGRANAHTTLLHARQRARARGRHRGGRGTGAGRKTLSKRAVVFRGFRTHGVDTGQPASPARPPRARCCSLWAGLRTHAGTVTGSGGSPSHDGSITVAGDDPRPAFTVAGAVPSFTGFPFQSAI